MKLRNTVIGLGVGAATAAGLSLAWVWGEGGCSKDKTNKDTKTEKVEETDA